MTIPPGWVVLFLESQFDTQKERPGIGIPMPVLVGNIWDPQNWHYDMFIYT